MKPAGRFCYLPITQLHFPSLAHPDHIGKTGHGEMADSLAEMDHNVGLIVDAIDDMGIAEDTLLIFGSDNGPEFREPWRGQLAIGAARITRRWKETCVFPS